MSKNPRRVLGGKRKRWKTADFWILFELSANTSNINNVNKKFVRMAENPNDSIRKRTLLKGQNLFNNNGHTKKEVSKIWKCVSQNRKLRNDWTDLRMSHSLCSCEVIASNPRGIPRQCSRQFHVPVFRVLSVPSIILSEQRWQFRLLLRESLRAADLRNCVRLY